MAIDFPNSPTLNQEFTSGGVVWKWDGSVWRLVRSSPTGPTGPTGAIGGAVYTFSTTTTDADPGNGVVRYNHATIGSVTTIFIDNVDAGAATQTAWYDTWDDNTGGNYGYLYVVNSATSATSVFNVINVTSATGYYKIGVTYISGSLPANNATISVSFNRAGNQSRAFGIFIS